MSRSTSMARGEPTDRRPPRVSIGLPVRNGTPHIAEAIESLLDQDFQDFELLISDNGSEDATPDACSAFARADSRVRYERLPENIGALRNFERVFSATRGKYFMWAAHDDRWDRSFIRRCVDALETCSEAILAVSDVRIINPSSGIESRHSFSADVSSVDPRRRLRWILRGGGWAAIYGLIRRQVLSRTRLLSALASVPSPGLSPDYLVVDLSLLGPFVRVTEPLFIWRSGTQRDLEALSVGIDPHRIFRGHETMFWWLFGDLWKISGRYRLGAPLRARLQTDFLLCAATPGTLHDVLVDRNTAALRAVVGARRWSGMPRLIVERLFLDPPSRYGHWRELLDQVRSRRP